MKKYAKAVVVLSLAIGAGCDDFIQGPGLTENPNNPVAGTAAQQLIAVQARMSTLLEGQLARTAGIYTQQIIGSNNQQLTVTGYAYGEGDYSGFFSGFYVGGGLVALRNIQRMSAESGDKLMEGVALIWEGLAMGTATSIWGDIPYSEAIDPAISTPKLDPQQDVYTAVLAKIDAGIAALQGASTAGNCEPADLVYCVTVGPRATQITRWIKAANTIKARFYLDLVERNGNAAYTQALAAATAGIDEAPANANAAMHGQAAGDFRMYHGSTQDVDGNIWAEFLTQRGGDIRAGNTLISILKARNDPRLQAYFAPNSTGGFFGLNQNNQVVGGAASEINITVRRQMSFDQPIVTWAENQLILAEAKFRLQGAAAALPHVNNVRTAVGLPALASVTFDEVMTEKYIAMFQNIGVWSDYRRTCIPVITPNGSAAEVPGRIPYGSAERNANPNIPLPSAYPSGTTGVSTLRNWNDPTACPRP
ncbi:MAG TPA: SusD/RagB family nutrient-binding outer membrane lipoprotein [Longimicrobiales bacterium]